MRSHPIAAIARPACVLLLLAATPSCNYIHFGQTMPAYQDVAAVYNWRTQDFATKGNVRSGQTITVQIEGINKVCYDYDVTVTQTAAVEKTADFLALLGADPEALKKLSESAPTGEAAAPAGGAGGGAGATKAPAPPGANPPPPPDFTKQKAELKDIAKLTADAKKAINDATDAIKPLADARAAAKKALETFYAEACPGGGNRGPGDVAALWRTAAAEIDKFVKAAPAATEAAKKLLDEAKEKLDDASKRAAAMRANTDPIYKAFLDPKQPYVVELEKEELYIENLTPKMVKPAETIDSLGKDKKTLEEATDQIPKLVSDTTIKKSVTVKDNTASVSVTVKATGKKGIASVKDASLQDVVEILVERFNRVFMTAGVMMSDIDEHHYDRVNLVKSDTTTFSTFADYQGSSSIAFSPAILTHVTLGSFGWIAEPLRATNMTVSGGLGVRTVADKSSPDFLLGTSLTFRDMVAVTFAWHKGRVEKLLLADSVMKHPLPAAITRQSAVGYDWRDAFAVLFTVRLP